MALFDTNAFRVLEQGMSVLWQKQQIIAQNISNADTPDYNCKYLDFAGILREKLRDNGTVDTELNLVQRLYIDRYTDDQPDGNNVDSDTQQAELLRSFQTNLMRISAVIALLVVGLSVLLSHAFTARITNLLQAIRKVREGAYSHRAEVRGGDEIAQIAGEFNSLTDRLQTTEDARRRFVSDASHELKTPLAGIRLLTDSILQTEDIDLRLTREFVGDIGQEADRLSRITEDLLRLTRLDSGAVEEAVAVQIAPVLERVRRMLGMVAKDKGVSLSFEVSEDAVVLATEDDVHQILYNLIENGIKYSAASGFVHTNVSVDDDWVILQVEDNGVGIADKDLPHVFERFYRVDKNRSRAVGGTGLGLSIVRDTVLRRGGTIEVGHRQSGVGTVFTVRLPRAQGGETA